MKAIQTRYFGPGNVRDSRIKAFDLDGNQVTISYPHECSGTSEDKHRLAAAALCQKMGWKGELVAGALKDGYVFVFLDPVPSHHPECTCKNHKPDLLIKTAKAVLDWARTPGEHGGNSYCKPMVKLAEQALGVK